ncbi:hypothetical protein [Aeromicrobium sp. CF3.5]|uniref:hypothetical protein n=1 Tax=Aeromicrobium sp. CF3.5 TaxID=3373078 RepID=UPI003EE50733
MSSEDRWYRISVGLTGGLIGFGVLLAVGREIVPDVLDLTQRRGYDAALVGAALLTATATAWWASLRFVGPWAASPAHQLWTIGDDQRAWRRRSAVRGAPWVALATGLVAVVVGLAAGELGLWAGGGTVLALLMLTAAIGSGQRYDGGPRGVVSLGGVAMGLLSGAACGPVAGGLVGGAAIAGGVLLAGRPTAQRFAAIPRWNLAAADRRRSAAVASVILVEPLVRQQRSGSRSRLATMPRHPAIRLALISTRRVAVPVLAWAVGGLVVAAALADLLGSFAGVAAVAMLLHVTTAMTSKGLLAFTSQVEVRRLLMMPRGPALAGLAIPCAAVTVVIVGAASVLMPLSVAGAMVLLALPALGMASRMSSAEATDELVMASTPMGAVPVQTVIRLVAGADATVLALVSLALLPS